MCIRDRDLNVRPPGPETKKFSLGVDFSIHVSGAATVQTHVIPARRSHSFSYGCPRLGAPVPGCELASTGVNLPEKMWPSALSSHCEPLQFQLQRPSSATWANLVSKSSTMVRNPERPCRFFRFGSRRKKGQHANPPSTLRSNQSKAFCFSPRTE